VEEKAQCALPVVNKVQVPLGRPHPLKSCARLALDGVFRRHAAFTASADFSTNGLALVSCRRGRGEWTVCVMNNTWRERPLALHSRVGKILSVEELPTSRQEQASPGYAPCGIEGFELGRDTSSTIAAGSVRMFRVRTRENGEVEEIAAVAPPANVSNAVLALRGGESVKEQVLRRPTFFRHYGGVMVDWTYLRRRDIRELRRERNWIDLQGLKVLVDASGAFNLFPDFRLVDNDRLETSRTDDGMRDIFGKMQALGAKILILSPSRRPETNMTEAEADRSMKKRLAELADAAAGYGVRLHLRNSPRRLTGSPQLLQDWTANGKIAPAASLAALSLACGEKRNLVEYILRPGEKKYDVTGRAPVYLLAAPGKDENGQLWSLHRPLATQTAVDAEALKSYLGILKKKDALFVYDALYRDVDEEYNDAKLWERL
jgi:hypothetical protein